MLTHNKRKKKPAALVYGCCGGIFKSTWKNLAVNNMEPAVKPNILIVDDIVANLYLLENILKPLDVNLIMAQSGEDALLKIQDQEIALALLDICMPGMDGVELTGIIQKDKSREITPIIFITANAKDELELEKCYESGAVDFMLKPIRKNILLSKVKVFLELYRQKQVIIEDHLELGKSANELILLNQTLKESHEKVLHSEKMLSSIIENLPLMLFVKDAKNLHYLSFNKAGEELLGYSKEEMIGKTDYDFLPSKEADYFKAIDRKVLESGVLKDIPKEKIQTKHKGERILHTRKIPLINSEGQTEFLLGISEDITSKNQIENALVESEKMYRTLLNASPEGIIILDIKCLITEISNITLEIFGYENKDEFIGTHFFHFIPRDELKKVKDVLSKTQSEGLVQNVEFIMTRKNQSQFVCELSTTLIQEADGKPKAYMAILRDISQRKKIEQQLIRAERMVSLGEMASAMAHEINQPLLSITLGIENMFLKMLQVNALDETYFHDKSEKIFEDISRIGRIIDHVRAFSRDHDDYIFTSFDINDSIKNAISLISEQFKHHGINLTFKLDEKILPIFGNTYRFEQVILNLLTNAKDALEEKMKTSKSDFEKTILIRTYHDVHANYVEVKDNGSGIKSDKIDRIMLPFYTTKETGKGTGLGLSISFGIIKELNGNIDIESNPNSGTIFRISLPVPENQQKKQ
jgi:PAS domain S-box-containing protein